MGCPVYLWNNKGRSRLITRNGETFDVPIQFATLEAWVLRVRNDWKNRWFRRPRGTKPRGGFHYTDPYENFAMRVYKQITAQFEKAGL
jgi:hypothetical protein